MSQLTIQLPDSVTEAAKELAARENLTVEEYLSRIVAEQMRVEEAWEQRVSRGRMVTREQILEILNKVPDVPPMPGDEIEP